MPRFKRGDPRPPNAGRKIGSKNRIPVAAKEAIHRALNAGDGAVAYLTKMRDSRVGSDRAAFMHLVGKLVPREIEVDLPPGDGQVPVTVFMPYNERGPHPSETVEEFRERTARGETFEQARARQAKK